jgi:hypothetical protein
MAAKKRSGHERGLKQVRQPSRRRSGRTQVNILLSDNLKDQLLAAAVENGRTLSAEAAAVLETAVHVNRVLAGYYRSGVRTTIAEMAAGIIETDLRLFGFAPLCDATGNVTWMPPGHPANSAGAEFAAAETGELMAMLEKSVELREEAMWKLRAVAMKMIKPASFEELEQGEWNAHAAAMTASETDIERRNAEAIKRSNLGAAFDIDASLKRADEIDRMAKVPAVVSVDVQPNFDAYDQLNREKDDAA